MTEGVVGALILLGSAFVFVSALGLVRMPDLYMRMHAATKAGTLGAGLMLAALAVFFGGLGVVAETAAVITFLLITAPVAAHVLGRASYPGVKLWERTQFDDYESYVYKDYAENRAENRGENRGGAPESSRPEAGSPETS